MSYVIKLCERNQSTGAIDRVTVTDNVLNGMSIVEKLDDSLDIGTIVVRGISTSSPYDMFSFVEILDGTTLLYSMRIAGDNVKLISKSPKLYEHSLALVEHTKILERFVVAGKTFTQPTDGTIRYFIYDVLEDLINTTPFETTTNLSTTRVCVLPSSGELYDFITTEVSPEFTFKDNTLRECFTQVGGYFDGIPRLVINSSDELELEFDLVNELKTLITDMTDFTEESYQQNIEFHGTELESGVLNLVNDTLLNESVEIYPSENAYASFRRDTYLQANFTDSFVVTPKKIYNVMKVICRVDILFQYLDDLGVTQTVIDGVVNVTIEENVLEKKIFDALDYFDTYTLGAPEVYKLASIFYNYREKNVTIGYEFVSGVSSMSTLLKVSLYRQYLEDGTIPAGTLYSDISSVQNEPDEDLLWQIHYVPIVTETRLSITREDLSDVKYNSTILSNQQSRIVNLEHFSNNMYGRINRIGNSELQLENRKASVSSLYDIGDYTSDVYIITEKEVIFYKDYVYAKYGLSKNYNMISRFIGVNSEVRQWEMGENNTLIRNLIYKEYVEIDATVSGSGSNSSQLITSDGEECYLDTFKHSSTNEPVRSGMMVGLDLDDTTLVSLSSNGGGNSLVFHWEFEDNISTGYFKETIAGQIAQEFVRYADEEGISENFTIYMNDKVSSASTEAAELARADAYPKTSITYINKTLLQNTSAFKMAKDSREVIGGTVLLQQIAKEPSRVILGRWLSLRNRLVSENPPSSFKLFYSTTEQLNRTDTLNVPTTFTEYVDTYTVTPSYANRRVNISAVSGAWSSWCLTDEDGKILIGVNQDGIALSFITFDFKNKRDDINYKY